MFISRGMYAQGDTGQRAATETSKSRLNAVGKANSLGTATIHWQHVPLRDAMARLQRLFEDPVFVDRRIDPNSRVTLDIEASSAEEVAVAVAAGKDWGVARLGRTVYLGPSKAANRLRSVAGARAEEIAHLTPNLRSPLVQKQVTEWPRLSQPRAVIASAIEQRGWRLANADRVPHDLWSAGELPALTLADQLTILLAGFDLSFEIRPDVREIFLVPLKIDEQPDGAGSTFKRASPSEKTVRPKKDGKRVYTLRVQQKPVGAVLREVAKRLQWQIEIDEEGIRKAGKSLDTRVSFSVENADREQLLEALVSPAGLDFQVDGDRVRVVAGRYPDK